MNICCLHCGSEKLVRCLDSRVIDHEVNQTLKTRYYECGKCHKAGTLTWWEVWVDGKIIISPVSGFQWVASEAR